MRAHQILSRLAGPSAVMAVVALLSAPCPATAQVPVSLQLDGAFYGDNTEFDGTFRSGETILGAFQRLFVEFRPGGNAAVRFGLFAQERAGSSSPVDHALPIVTLDLGSPHQRFIVGTLDPNSPRSFGPDRTTPHGLLPPLAVETLWFTRAYEAGIEWLVNADRIRQDAWLDYQLENTAEHREKLDAGVVGRARIGGPVYAGYQFHIVHHGGQQYATGPVSDSLGFAPSLVVEGPLGGLDLASAEVFVLAAFDRPDRFAATNPTLEGHAVFVRLAAETRGWRGHLIAWRGHDFNHEDGDPNYLSRFSNGTLDHGTREYSEVGIARLMRPAPGLEFEASFRVHRIDSDYGYSYRLLGTVHLALWHGTISAAR